MKGFTKEIGERFVAPWSWAFAGYLVIVLLFGGLGIYFTLYDVMNNNWCYPYKIAESISTFFIAVIATSFIDLNLSPKLKNRTTFLIYSFIFYGIAVFLLWLTYQEKSGNSFYPAFIGTALALFVWVLANSDNTKLKEGNFYNEMRGDRVGHGDNWQ